MLFQCLCLLLISESIRAGPVPQIPQGFTRTVCYLKTGLVGYHLRS